MIKYKVHSVQPVMPVMVRVSETDSQDTSEILAYVDYGGDRVYFAEAFPGSEDLEKEILASLDTAAMFQEPTLPADLMAEIDNLRNGEATNGVIWNIEDFHG